MSVCVFTYAEAPVAQGDHQRAVGAVHASLYVKVSQEEA